MKKIELRGVCVHNLKSVDLDLPLGKIIAFCGRSGSGKSSLAIDTLYAEGQRRYIESFTVHERRFLERIEKPDARRIDGIPPAIAIDSRSVVRNSKLDIGDASEISDHLQILYSKIGTIICPKCGKTVIGHDPESVLEELETGKYSDKLLIAFAPENGYFPENEAEFRNVWIERGFVRGLFAGSIFRIDEGSIFEDIYIKAKKRVKNDDPVLLLVMDRINLAETEKSRILESLEAAFRYGSGILFIVPYYNLSQSVRFSKKAFCCGHEFAELEPGLFRTETDDSLYVKLGNRGVFELLRAPAVEILDFLKRLELSERETKIARPVLFPVISRLDSMCKLGISYLELSRKLSSLSDGERRRISLLGTLGSALSDILYVLDEPSIGLHPLDIEKLQKCLEELRDRGNTVVLVDHEELLLRNSDQIIEIGPGAGESGGKIVFQGTPEELKSNGNSLSGRYLYGKFDIEKKKHNRILKKERLILEGANGRNLDGIDLSFPLGGLCIVCGPSGSGKSTLIRDTLYAGLSKRLHPKAKAPDPLPFSQVHGYESFDDIVMIDQSPIGRSSRSNPASRLKIFDDIRNIFAETHGALVKGFSAGDFSFNIPGGRCEACKGEGSIEIDMQFMADLSIKCPECGGKRYRRAILEATYRNKNISEILEMTAREAFGFFRGQAKIQHKLKFLLDLGLDYIVLGQPGNTLSGGESQRLKLAEHLSRTKKGRCLFLMDEPSTGLHFFDVDKLLECFDSLISLGHSFIVIEHNLKMIKAADHLIELGPGPGKEGGRIIASGTPEDIRKNPGSITGRFM